MGFASLVWLMSVAYGFQYLVMADKEAHFTYFRIATLPYALIVILLTRFALGRPALSLEIERSPAWLGVLMMSCSWVLACFFYSAMLAPLPWFAAASAVPLLALLARWKSGERAAVAAFLIGALAMFVYLIARIPHDVGGGDMLQIIDFAARDLLNGKNPFQPYLTVSGKEVPFGYWPGIWLPYVPLVALGVDMRVLNLCLFGLLLLLFWKATGGGERGARILSIVLLPFLLSSQILQMIISGHLWLYWLLVSAALWFVTGKRYHAAAVLLGLCLATRPTVLFVAGPVFAYVWSRESLGLSLRCGVIALGVALALNAPFYFIYGDDFVRNSYGVLAKISHDLTHFSLLGILQAVGLWSLGKPIQVVIALAAMGLIMFRRSLTPAQFVTLAGLIYIWEVLFASYATRYTYFGGFLLVALGLSMAYAEKAGRSAALEDRSA